jgi:hypothetical protein
MTIYLMERTMAEAAPTTKTKLAGEGGAMAAAGLSMVTGPLQGALMQLAVHDAGADHSPMKVLMTKAAIGAGAVSGTRRSFMQAHQQGLSMANLRAKEADAHTVSIPKSEIADPAVSKALRRDLGILAGDDRTALDLNARMPASAVGARFDAAMAGPGDTLRIDLRKVGIRTTPNLKRALSEYGRGGREDLAASKLVPAPEQAKAAETGKTRSRRDDDRGM